MAEPEYNTPKLWTIKKKNLTMTKHKQKPDYEL